MSALSQKAAGRIDHQKPAISDQSERIDLRRGNREPAERFDRIKENLADLDHVSVFLDSLNPLRQDRVMVLDRGGPPYISW